MKLTSLLFIVSLFYMKADNSYSQNTKISLDMESVNIMTVLEKIESLSEFNFLGNENVINDFRLVTIKANKKRIYKILDELFTGTNIAYKVIDRQIVLVKEAKLNKTVPRELIDYKQGQTVNGTIKDAAGIPLAGATVVEKGTQNGSQTDFDGKFSIEVSNQEAILLISYVGFVTQEIAVTDKTEIAVIMEEDTAELEEVVVVGYGRQKEVNVTGAVTTIKADDLVDRPVTNLQQALQGMAPGLQLTVNNTGGQPDGAFSISLRGIGSINGGASPLVVVDDMPLSDTSELQDINPEDIESISVLSDAASSAIYGSRAAYGVILITTKSGEALDGVRINYSNNFIFSSPTNLPNQANSLIFAEYMNTAAANDGSSPIFSDETIARIKASMADPSLPTTEENTNGDWKGNFEAWANTDWFDEFYKDSSSSQRHNLSISGKKGKTKYYVSGSYYDGEGILKYSGEEFKRYTINSKISSDINPWLDFSANIRYSGVDFERTNGITGDYGRFLHDVARRYPTNPVTAPNGDYYWSNNGTYNRPGTGQRISKDNNFYTNFGFTIKPVEGLKIRTNLFFNNINNKLTSHYAKVSYRRPDGSTRFLRSRNSFSRAHSTTTYMSPNINAEYSYSLNDKHNFKVLAGFQQELSKSERVGGSNSGLISDNVPSISTAVDDNENAFDSASHWATRGYFGRLNYNYDEKYLAEFVIRRDGSSRYGRDSRWANLPSMSIGYNIAKEDFWPIDEISSFKIRGSYGKVGNQNVGNYAYISNLSVRTNLWWLTNGSRPVYVGQPSLISPDLTWEKVISKNLGFDVKAFNNRLSMQANIYERITEDMTGPSERFPATLGISAPRANNAELSTKGFELVLGWKDTIGEEFNYSAILVLSNSKTKIKKFSNPEGLLNNWYEGETVGDIWGYETEGIFQTDAEAQAWFDQSDISSRPWLAGDIAYRDINGDGEITNGSLTFDDPGDRRVIGNSMPRLPFSINLAANYKGFDVSMFWQGVAKRDAVQSSAYFYGTTTSKWQVAVFDNHLDYWTPDNPDAYFARPIFAHTWKNQQTQTRFLQDASYMRLKNLQIGYSIPNKILAPFKIHKARVFFSGENLLTLTNMIDIFDPEAIGGNWGDGKIYPLSRTFSMGINLKF